MTKLCTKKDVECRKAWPAHGGSIYRPLVAKAITETATTSTAQQVEAGRMTTFQGFPLGAESDCPHIQVGLYSIVP